MPLQIDPQLRSSQLRPALLRLFELSGQKILALDRRWERSRGAPVFTIDGNYASRGWTEWTQGFQFGAALLQFEVTGDAKFLAMGKRGTVESMASHVSHIGVHDHGFNNVSTYGNLLRLVIDGKIDANPDERRFYELALKISGAVQASRWTSLGGDAGYIYSFNGPHSLFIDTMRTLRSLACAHQLGHVLMGEQDASISLLGRLIQHARTTARHNIYFGEARDRYDVRGRTAHEAIFNVVSGAFRCPSSQQGYSPFTTWTRGLAWAITGFAEQLEFLKHLNAADTAHQKVMEEMELAATATAEFYLEHCAQDGICYWDTGAPNLWRMGNYLDAKADPFNAYEPVDSSAAAIAAQGFLRLGSYLAERNPVRAARFRQAGLTLARTLFAEPYLSTDERHEGLLLHTVYHRPNGWDHIRDGQKIPNGESAMWGDYHLRELGVMLWRETEGATPHRFFDILES